MITYDEARELFDYDAERGLLIWKKLRPRSRGRLGEPVGTVYKGRRVTRIAGRSYPVARLVWLWHKGEFPPGLLDHRDGDTLNDRIGNLRPSTRKQNAENMDYRSPVNAAGLRGVIVRGRRYQARIVNNGKVTHLGTFDTAEEASAAYRKAKTKAHPFWVRGKEED